MWTDPSWWIHGPDRPCVNSPGCLWSVTIQIEHHVLPFMATIYPTATSNTITLLNCLMNKTMGSLFFWGSSCHQIWIKKEKTFGSVMWRNVQLTLCDAIMSTESQRDVRTPSMKRKTPRGPCCPLRRTIQLHVAAWCTENISLSFIKLLQMKTQDFLLLLVHIRSIHLLEREWLFHFATIWLCLFCEKGQKPVKPCSVSVCLHANIDAGDQWVCDM